MNRYTPVTKRGGKGKDIVDCCVEVLNKLRSFFDGRYGKK
jgi:hypothetical protein